MFSLSYLLAVALLTTPPDAPEGTNLDGYTYLRPTLQSLAVQWEVLDPREVRYILARPEDFVSDLTLLQRRFQEYANAPNLCDGLRFPDRATVNDFLAFNRAYRQHIDVRQPVEMAHWWELRTALQETDQLYQVWDMVRDARCDYYYVTVRRGALKRLRELIGEEAYYAGRLPPVVPTWRLQRVN